MDCRHPGVLWRWVFEVGDLPEDEDEVVGYGSCGVPDFIAHLVEGVYPGRQVDVGEVPPQEDVFPSLLGLLVNYFVEDRVKSLLWCIFAFSATRGGSYEYCGQGGCGDWLCTTDLCYCRFVVQNLFLFRARCPCRPPTHLAGVSAWKH